MHFKKEANNTTCYYIASGSFDNAESGQGYLVKVDADVSFTRTLNTAYFIFSTDRTSLAVK
ncbi:hypothetical protein [Polaribacter glomeratus]|uniref:Uncharacterized protein n=1 Tax=Polaribacter glomeratus TaxID=102 RepID=A0A2S7WHQ0_9FLAO|nr:hypothetical protein [Polaribacter glomeratus]PQJ77130.1 hypothetical protein BTO16_14895 [Polaribacter glomeratus]TXD67019.1 hypothetical protein ESX12_00020 [Polaribacter glomeratus]